MKFLWDENHKNESNRNEKTKTIITEVKNVFNGFLSWLDSA